METKIYLAYGSNMDLAQMKARCRGARLLGAGRLDGWRLLFKGSRTGAYATIEREAGKHVPVLLWRVTAEDEKSLDRYEGFPDFYYKRQLQAVTVNAAGRDCGRTRGMAYVMHEERRFGLPQGWYAALLERTYETASRKRSSGRPWHTRRNTAERGPDFSPCVLLIFLS